MANAKRNLSSPAKRVPRVRIAQAYRSAVPATLASPDALAHLQAELLRGVEGRFSKPGKLVPRSPHSVKAIMVNVRAALNFAAAME